MDIDSKIHEIKSFASSSNDETEINRRCDNLLRSKPKSWAVARCWLKHRSIRDMEEINPLINQILDFHQEHTDEILKKLDEKFSDFEPSIKTDPTNLEAILKPLGISNRHLAQLPRLTCKILDFLAMTGSGSDLRVLGDVLNDAKVIHPSVSSIIATIFPKFGLSDLAIKLCQYAVQNEPTSWAAQRALGEALLKCEKYTEALRHFRKIHLLQKNDLGGNWTDLKYPISRIAFINESLGNLDLALEGYFEAYKYDTGALGSLLMYCIKAGDEYLIHQILHGFLRSSRSMQAAQACNLNAAVQFLRLPPEESKILHQMTLGALMKLDLDDERDTHNLAKNRFLQIGALGTLFPYGKLAPDFTKGRYYKNYNTEILEKYDIIINTALYNTYSPHLLSYDPTLGVVRKPDLNCIEIFIPDALFIEKKRETLAHENIRGIFSTIVDRVISSGYSILPRHQFRNGLADPSKRTNKVFSYHTHAVADSFSTADHWHYKESHLSGTFHLETGGYSGWSNMQTPEKRRHWFRETDERAARRYVNDLKNVLLRNNQSKYSQSSVSTTDTNSPYCFLVLQIIDDAVAAFAHIKPRQLIETCADMLAGSGVRLIIKRHPLCSSGVIKQALDEACEQPHVELSSDSIHDLFPNAYAIITTNSGAGFEALIHGKPVITVGKSDYTDYTSHCTDLNHLRSALKLAQTMKLKPHKEVDLFLCNYLKYNVVSLNSRVELHKRIDEALTSPENINPRDNPYVRQFTKSHKYIYNRLYESARSLSKCGYSDFAISILPDTALKDLSVSQLSFKTTLFREVSDVENWELHQRVLKERDRRLGRMEEVSMILSGLRWEQNRDNRICEMIKEHPKESYFLNAFLKLQRNQRFKYILPRIEYTYSDWKDDSELLSYAEYLNSVGRSDEAIKAIAPLNKRKLSFVNKNKLFEQLCRIYLEKEEHKTAQKAISSLHWFNKSDQFENIDKFINFEFTEVNAIPESATVIVTDIQFEREGKGSHVRIKRICELIESIGKNQVVVVYYGKIDDPLIATELLFSSNRQWIPLLLFGIHHFQKVIDYMSGEIPRGPNKLTQNLTRFLKASLELLLEEIKPKQVIYEYIWSAPLHIPDWPSAIDTHDLQHVRTNRLRENGLECSFPVSREEESDALRPFDTIIAITNNEAEGFREILPENTIVTIPHLPEINLRPTPSRIEKLGFIGGDQSPNVDGICWFLKENWPVLDKRFELHIYGDVIKMIPKNLVSERVFLHGRIDNLDDAYSHCDAFVAPILTGSGLKIKVVEAMAESRIVFSTPCGAEGIESPERLNPVIFEPEYLLTEEIIIASFQNYEARVSDSHIWLMANEEQIKQNLG